MNATSQQHQGGNGLWPPPPLTGPSSIMPEGGHPPLHVRLSRPPPSGGPRLQGGPPPNNARPFFIREIYKNGFLKQLSYHKKKSSALSKLMKTDRYWVVFSVHDDTLPFLELWAEPTEVASKPPQFMFPLAVCQHISPSLVPAGDHEWTFVVNFETVAIRFSCNSRQTMEEWVECIRNKLGEMGILNPKGNLYSKVPAISATKTRNPMSPLPQPPANTIENEDTAEENNSGAPGQLGPRTRTSIVDSSDQTNQSFTTSIYLNQTPPQTPQQLPSRGSTASQAINSLLNSPNAPKALSGEVAVAPAPCISVAKPVSSQAGKAAVEDNKKLASGGDKKHQIPAKSYEPVVVTPKTTSVVTSVSQATTITTPTSNSGHHHPGTKSSVYLNKSNPTRHVTVIPINSIEGGGGGSGAEEESEPYYDAIFDEQTDVVKSRHPSSGNNSKAHPSSGKEKKRQQSPSKQPNPPPKEERSSKKQGRSREDLTVSRRFSDRREGRSSGQRERDREHVQQQPQRIKKKSQRSSGLGPLLDDNQMTSAMANTNSLESIDSNPRQALPKGDSRHHHGRIKGTGAVPRRPLPIPNVISGSTTNNNNSGQIEPSTSPTHHPPANLVGSPARHLADLPPGVRPPPYHPLSSGPPMPGTHPPHPPHIPLPGLTCQLSLMLPQPQAPPPTPSGSGNDLSSQHPPPGPPHHLRPSLREQQVIRLRQEIAHPAGVRLTLRKRDCQNSLALVELFGCLWVAGWKQRDYPVLYNAFHIGDQILTVAGSPVRTAGDFNKLVKHRAASSGGGPQAGSGGSSEIMRVEIIVRRLPFAQVFHLKRDVDGQPLGLVLNGNTAECREIVPGSPAAVHGMSARVRSLDGQTLVAWHLTEVNGRPFNLLAKDGEAGARLQALGRDISVLVQPADFVAKLRKQLKSHRNYKDFLLG